MSKNEKIRNHFSCIIFKNAGILVMLLYLCIGLLIEKYAVVEEAEGKVDTEIVFLILMAALIVKLCFDINAWRKTYIYFDENSIVMEKNTINSKKVTISLHNIANVNADRNLLGALIGVRKVKIDTNSSGTATAPEMILYLKKEKAKEFQDAIAMVKNGGKLQEGEPVKETKTSVGKCIVHCIITADVASAFSVAFILVVFFVLVMNTEDNVKIIVSIIMTLVESIAFVLFGMLSYAVKNIMSYYGFTVYREGREIFIKYGLFDKKSYRIDVGRINALKIVRPPLGIIFKQEYAEIVCAGLGDEEKERSLLLLSDSHEKLVENLMILLPEFYKEDMNLYKCKKAKYMYAINFVIYVIMTIVALLVAGLYVEVKYIIISGVAAIIFGIYLIGSWILKYVDSGYELQGKLFVTSSGGYTKNTTIVPYERIEHLETEQSLIKRAMKAKTATFYIKSGSILSGIINTCMLDESDMAKIIAKYRKTYIRR